MKSTSRTIVMLIVTGGIIFNLIFWNEQIAVNAIIFDAFVIASLFKIYSPQKNKNFNIFLAIHLFCLMTVILHNTYLSVFSWGVTMLLTVAYAQYVHRSVWFAGGAAMLSFAVFFFGFLTQLANLRTKKKKKSRAARYFFYAVIPLGIAFIFFIVYISANNVFASLFQQLSWTLENYLTQLVELFYFQRICFLLFGIYLTGALLLRASTTFYEKKEAVMVDDLQRDKVKRRMMTTGFLGSIGLDLFKKQTRNTMALKTENTIGIISLVLLNLMLLVVNIIDIDFLWLNFSPSPGLNLSNLIHEGTEQLIFSIILAILVLLFFFRGNLNFYKNNKWLRYGAYLWLFQNFILVVSVLLRDYYYIREMGLAYKRIGVLFFLVAVLVGLITAFIKIRYCKTRYFLFRMNAFILICFLALASAVNWDLYIAKYNIAHKDRTPVDVRFLLELSDKALPVLDKNIAVLRERERELNEKGIWVARCKDCIDRIINDRKKMFLHEQESLTWLSWNKSDNDVKQYLQ